MASSAPSIPAIWAATAAHSPASFLMSRMNFSTLVFVGWTLIILQPLGVLCFVCPVGGQPGYTLEFYEPPESDIQPAEGDKSLGYTEWTGEYKTLGNPQQNHFTALNLLADASRMECVAMACSEQIEFQGKTDKGFQILNATFFEMRRVTGRFALRSVIEGSYQIN